MGKEKLPDYLKQNGEKLIRGLTESNAGFEITSARWYYLPEPEEWRLIIYSPYVLLNGPLKSYKLIQSVISKRKLALSLDEISVFKPR